MPTIDPTQFPSDEQNPYAPPRSDLKLEPASFDLMPVRFSIDDVFARSWQIYRGRMGFCIGLVAVWLALMVGLYVAAVALMAVAQNAQDSVVIIVGAIMNAALLVAMILMSLGLVCVMLDVARGREATIGGLFSGARFLWRVLLAGILSMLAMYGSMLVGALVGAVLAVLATSAFHANPLVGIPLMSLGVLPGFIVGYIFWLRLSQFFYLIVDRDLGVIDSLRVSYRITRGHAGLLFVIALVTGLINFGGMLACGVGIFFTTPYLVLLNVVAYLALSGQAAADSSAKGEPLDDLEPL